ncbi:unnamed protein product [Lasius platythorax]|uniref:Uncharacterized protein n=1 Tax=Lasius platythorax TaxID=488582 RepID=A0AAV2NAX4_9HYME
MSPNKDKYLLRKKKRKKVEESAACIRKGNAYSREGTSGSSARKSEMQSGEGNSGDEMTFAMKTREGPLTSSS